MEAHGAGWTPGCRLAGAAGSAEGLGREASVPQTPAQTARQQEPQTRNHWVRLEGGVRGGKELLNRLLNTKNIFCEGKKYTFDNIKNLFNRHQRVKPATS